MNSIETTDRLGRPMHILKTNSVPDIWVGEYTDIVWNGGWMSIYKENKDAQFLRHEGPQPGQIFKHYKGGLYTVLLRSVHEETNEQLVTYQSNLKGFVWTRSLEDFNAVVENQGHWVIRFKRMINDLDLKEV